MRVLAIVLLLVFVLATPVSATFYQELTLSVKGEYSLSTVYTGSENTSRIVLVGEGEADLSYIQAIMSDTPHWWDLF